MLTTNLILLVYFIILYFTRFFFLLKNNIQITYKVFTQRRWYTYGLLTFCTFFFSITFPKNKLA